jgi:predicted dehydrogenase
MAEQPLSVAVLGAGRWSEMAHIPGWQRDRRCEVVTICDVDVEKAESHANTFDIPEATDDWESVVENPEVDIVDVATPSDTHFELSMAALEADKHVLCEKPVAHDYRDTRTAAELADEKGLQTKLGFTFRYSPGVQYAMELIEEGFVGEPYFFNGYEQNSQFLDPRNPLRQEDPREDQSEIQVASLEGYGAPVIDIGHWWTGADYDRVVGTMQNFVPERLVRGHEDEDPMRMNIDDGDVFIGEYDNGALGTIQTSFVTVGNYPGIEARIYGSKGAIICRLVQEHGTPETIKVASPPEDDVDKARNAEFEEREIPQRFYPEGGDSEEDWRTLFYANLIRDFLDEITGEADENQGDFHDGARVQESINAMTRAAREDRWVGKPLDGDDR